MWKCRSRALKAQAQKGETHEMYYKMVSAKIKINNMI